MREYEALSGRGKGPRLLERVLVPGVDPRRLRRVRRRLLRRRDEVSAALARTAVVMMAMTAVAQRFEVRTAAAASADAAGNAVAAPRERRWSRRASSLYEGRGAINPHRTILVRTENPCRASKLQCGMTDGPRLVAAGSRGPPRTSPPRPRPAPPARIIMTRSSLAYVGNL